MESTLLLNATCVRIQVLLYEKEDEPHRIPYEWVPSHMIEDVYKHAMKPYLYPPHCRIHHLMTFMKYYEGEVHITRGIDCMNSI